MSYWSLYGRDTVTSGESFVMMRPNRVQPVAKKGIIFCHGSGSTSTMAIDYLGATRLLTLLAGEGHPILSGDWGGIDTWANDTALSRITAGKNYLQSNMGAPAGQIILIGVSMGGANSLAWAGNNPTLAAGVVGLIPVVDFLDIQVNQRMGLHNNLNSAYGGNYVNDVYGPTHSPQSMADWGKFDGIPIRTYYGDTDTACVPVTQVGFAAASGAIATSLSGGHDSSTLEQINTDEVLSFIAGL
jgi:acetyl esterase/lipase